MYGFNTEDRHKAVAALAVYVVYRSRSDRFTVSTKMWEQITGFVKLAAKKSENVPEFLERFRKPMKCDAIKPHSCAETSNGTVAQLLDDGTIFVSGEDRREFATSVFEQCNDSRVLSRIINETAFIILLVRERLENEKTAKIKESV